MLNEFESFKLGRRQLSCIVVSPPVGTAALSSPYTLPPTKTFYMVGVGNLTGSEVGISVTFTSSSTKNIKEKCE